MKDALAAWLPIAFIAALGALPAVLANWSPWQIVLLVAVLGVVGAVVGGVWAWYSVQTRRIELTPLTTDDQAARLLGEALAQHGGYVHAPHLKDVWEAFAALPSESKRALAAALVGLLSGSGSFPFGLGDKVAALARGFYKTDTTASESLPLTDEQAARSLGESLGRCAGLLDEGLSQEIWATFAALNGEPKRALAAAVAGFFATASHTNIELGSDSLRDLVRSFRPHGQSLDELLTPEFPSAATP